MVEAEYTIEKTDGKDYDKPGGGAGDPTIPPGHSRFYCEKCRTVRCPYQSTFTSYWRRKEKKTNKAFCNDFVLTYFGNSPSSI